MSKYEERRCGIWGVLKGHPGEPECDPLHDRQGSFLPGATPQASWKLTRSISLLCKAGPTEVKQVGKQSGDFTEAVIPGVVCDLEDPGSGGSQPRAALPEGASSKGLEVVAVGLWWIVPAAHRRQQSPYLGCHISEPRTRTGAGFKSALFGDPGFHWGKPMAHL